MSTYPECHHGHADPNFSCPACDLEKEHRELLSELREKLFAAQVEIGNLSEQCYEMRAALLKNAKGDSQITEEKS